jgi:hypothetical protein
MLKFSIAVFALPLLAASAPPEITPAQMVRRALDAYSRGEAAQREYSYCQRDDVRILDGSGGLKHHDLRTFDVIMVDGSPYRRLVKRNDQALPPDEEKEQQEDFRRGIDQRHNETPEQRRQRIAEWDHKRQERQGDMNEVPNAFDFRLVGEETISGVPVWVIEGTPHPGYKPKSKSAGYFLKMRGRIWLTKEDYHVVKVDAVTLDAISIGAFLLRIAQGGHVGIEFSHMGNGLWLPKHASISGSARILLIKGYRLDADYTFSDYRRVDRVPTVAASSY